MHIESFKGSKKVTYTNHKKSYFKIPFKPNKILLNLMLLNLEIIDRNKYKSFFDVCGARMGRTISKDDRRFGGPLHIFGMKLRFHRRRCVGRIYYATKCLHWTIRIARSVNIVHTWGCTLEQWFCELCYCHRLTCLTSVNVPRAEPKLKGKYVIK